MRISMIGLLFLVGSGCAGIPHACPPDPQGEDAGVSAPRVVEGALAPEDRRIIIHLLGTIESGDMEALRADQDAKVTWFIDSQDHRVFWTNTMIFAQTLLKYRRCVEQEAHFGRTLGLMDPDVAQTVREQFEISSQFLIKRYPMIYQCH